MSAPIVLRQRSGPVITVIVWVFLAYLLGDALARGAWDTVGRFGPALLLIGWLVFAVLWRPGLVVRHDRVEVREILRTTALPYIRIRDIRLSATVAIDTISANGRTTTIRPWNAPGRPRRKIDSGLTGGMPPESLPNHPSFELHRRWEQALADRRSTSQYDTTAHGAESAIGVDSRWNLGVIGVTVVLVLLVVLGFL